jgi:hypothetical protein
VEPYSRTTYTLSHVAQETEESTFIYVIYLFNNIKLQHPVALCRSDFAFRFLPSMGNVGQYSLAFSLFPLHVSA